MKHTFQWSAAILGYYCWFQAMYNNMQYGTVYPYLTSEDAIMSISSNLMAVVIIFIMNLIIVFKGSRNKRVIIKVSIDLILSFSGLMVFNLIYLLLHGIFRNTTLDWTGTILNNIIILSMVEAVYYFQNYKTSQKIAEEADKKIIQYKYEALKAQINPHFLFNSLSLLSSLVSIDSHKAKRFIIELASIYRYILAHEGSELTSVREELEFLNTYLKVLDMRYKDKLTVKIIGSAPKGANIVPYTMQLLMENVTKHNVISTKYPMVVTVSMMNDKILVSNPVCPRPTKATSGIGLRYLKGIYSSHGGEFTVSNNGNTFTVSIPYIKSQS